MRHLLAVLAVLIVLTIPPAVKAGPAPAALTHAELGVTATIPDAWASWTDEDGAMRAESTDAHIRVQLAALPGDSVYDAMTVYLDSLVNHWGVMRGPVEYRGLTVLIIDAAPADESVQVGALVFWHPTLRRAGVLAVELDDLAWDTHIEEAVGVRNSLTAVRGAS